DHDRIFRVVEARCDLPLERLLVGALEVAKRFGPGPLDSRVAVADGLEVLLAAGLDAGKLELLAEDLRELLERDVDLEEVLAWIAASAEPFRRALRDRRPFLARTLAH